MLTDVYDLTGKPQRSRYCEKGCDTATLVARHPLRDLLITPRRGSNRTPYLQDPENPNLEDFWDEKNQTFTFGNAKPLSGILKGLSEDNAAATSRFRSLLEQYFYALKAECPPSSNITRNIIVVPDNYDANTQECILSNSLPREKTLLLWRSVAAVLGAEKQLEDAGVKAGDHVAVIDFQDRFVDISMLEIEIEDGYITPVRQAYRHGMNREKNDRRYPLHVAARKTRIVDDPQESKVIKASFRDGCNDDLPVWQKNDWVLSATKKAKALVIQSENTVLDLGDLTHESKFCIICSSHPFSNMLLHQLSRLANPIFEPENRSFISDGAGKYSVRLDNDLPTYYDECEQLSIVAQDRLTQDVIAEELIPHSTRCKGGKVVEGSPYLNASILPNQEYAEFYLLLGDNRQRYVKLKKLKHEFPLTQNEQPLKLVPSLIPGQGLARVDVYGEPLLKAPIRLELLKLEESEKSIDSLNKEVGRSFPADVPGVIADDRLWEKIEGKVIRWLDGKIKADGAWFAQSRKLNPFAKIGKVSELSRFAEEYSLSKFEQAYIKINVFGTYPGCEKPESMNSSIYQRIINKLKPNKKTSIDFIDSQLVRLIAWSYQGDNPEFDDFKKDVLKYLSNPNNKGQQFRTLCANLLREDDEFYQFCEIYCERVSGGVAVDDFNRTIADMLMRNSNALRFNHLSITEGSDMCNKVARVALKVLSEYAKGGCKKSYFLKRILTIILFLLRRRKFDKDFFNGELRNTLNSLKNDLLFYQSDTGLTKLYDVVINYVEAKGTLDGMIAISDQVDG